MSKIIVIEGLDGAGKSTQIELLSKYLNKKKISFDFRHFPTMSTKYFGELIAKFLRGDFGLAKDVDPYLVAMLYAGDRHNSLDFLKNEMKSDVILLDRYVYSNMAFQCAKLQNINEKNELRKWIHNLEFEHFNLPKATKSIFLNVPFEFTKKQLSAERSGSDRDYLQGKEDIHESDINLQKNVLNEYLTMLDLYDDFMQLDCTSNNIMLSPEEIHRKIVNIISDEL